MGTERARTQDYDLRLSTVLLQSPTQPTVWQADVELLAQILRAPSMLQPRA